MSARPVVKILPLPGRKHAAVCAVKGCGWASAVHVVKAGAEDEARIHRQTHRAPAPEPAPVVRRRLVDYARPLPASVIARMADTEATHCALVGEPLWLRCPCGAWVTGWPGDTAAEIREEAEEIGWEREGGDGRWQCPRCALAADKKRRAAA